MKTGRTDRPHGEGAGSLRAEVEAVIREAFLDTRLEGGISLRQTAVIDDWMRGYSEAEFAALQANEVTGDWTAIPPDELDAEYLAHLDAEGLRYYLPALMLRLLDDYGDVSPCGRSEPFRPSSNATGTHSASSMP